LHTEEYTTCPKTSLGTALEAEQVLEGRDANEEHFRAAAEAALRDAKPLHDNAFKVELAKRTLVRTLRVVTQAA
jgi:xanthine dehydrogenase YagS FAD-binding subunit